MEGDVVALDEKRPGRETSWSWWGDDWILEATQLATAALCGWTTEYDEEGRWRRQRGGRVDESMGRIQFIVTRVSDFQLIACEPTGM